MKSILTSSFLSLALLLSSHAEGLKIGDAAPELQVGEWVQGEAVKGFDKDKVYIVEFWATWCGPCRAVIPHMDELHEKYKDKGLVIIGQNVWEREEEKVRPFITDMGEKMSYRVAMDKKIGEDGYMSENWMKAAGQSGIPCSFVIGKDGKIAYIGHPSSVDEDMIVKVMDGKFDSAEAAKVMEAKQASQKKMMAFQKRIGEKSKAEDWDGAIGVIDEMVKEDPKMEPRMQLAKLNFQAKKGDAAAIQASLKAIQDGEQGKRSGTYYSLAMILLMESQKPSAEIIKQGQTLAEKGLSLVESSDPPINKPMLLSAKARAQFLGEDKEGAVKTQQEAVDACQDERAKKDQQEILTSYQEGKLPDPKGIKR